MAGLFISYRRSDNPDAVGRIYDRLVAEFGKHRVFKDVDSIPLGQDFRAHLNEVIGSCAAVLVVIGPKWTDIRNDSGQRRLEDPEDFVRVELEVALARHIPVVPVLVGNATLPQVGMLPEPLKSLAYRQAIQVRPDPDFHNDATRLVSSLRLLLDPDAALRRHWPAKWIAAVAAASIAAIALAVPAWKHLGKVPLAETRVDIATPETDSPLDFELSPDGKRIVFVARGDGASRLWMRSLDSAVAQPLPGTEGAANPFWSPDSQSIAFFAHAALKRLDLDGGLPRTLASVRQVGAGKGAWGEDGSILFSTGIADSMQRVADTGGALTTAVPSGPRTGWPTTPIFLPGSRQFLFVFREGGSGMGIHLGSLDGQDPVRLVSDVSSVAYHPSGWMLWVRAGALVAQRLDVKAARLVGQPVTIADGVMSASVAGSGLIAYRAGTARLRELRWMDRTGAVLGTVGEPDGTFSSPSLASDGQRVAVIREVQGNADIWLLDATRARRVSFEPAADFTPVLSPDGTRVAFASSQTDNPDIHVKASDGSGEERALVASGQPEFPTSWSADGRYLLYAVRNPETGWDLGVVSMTGDPLQSVLLNTPDDQVWGRFSPDGKWIAYRSSETKRDEVYVRPFVPPESSGAGSAAMTGGHWQISTDGGTHPVWSADGKELYYVTRAGEIMVVPITVNGRTLVPGAPKLLFRTSMVGAPVQGRQYDVARDGRFLVNTELPAGASPPITLIQNWNPDSN